MGGRGWIGLTAQRQILGSMKLDRREGKFSGDEQEMKEACQLPDQSQQGIDEFPKDEDSSDDFGMAREMIDSAEI